MTAVVTKDSQLPLPRELCEQLGLAPGQTLEIHGESGLLVAWKKSANDPFEKWRGRGQLPTGKNADEYLRLIRDGDGRCHLRAARRAAERPAARAGILGSFRLTDQDTKAQKRNGRDRMQPRWDSGSRDGIQN